MERDIQAAVGDCPKCGAHEVACRYNHFERDELVIDAWEHRCPNCGYRATTAFRSDDPEPASNPTICPYCQRSPRA